MALLENRVVVVGISEDEASRWVQIQYDCVIIKGEIWTETDTHRGKTT